MSQSVELAGFVIGDVLGAGGFAVVWSARGGDGVERALKVARAGDDLTRQRFERERLAMAAVGPPHAPEVIAAGALTDGRPYLLLEKIDGPSLSAWISGRAQPPPAEDWAPVADAILASLAAAHARGVVHRDFKPENLILGAGGARLIDFGLALVAGAPGEATRAGVAAGTVAYQAPERLRGETGDARADVYACGAVLFEMLTLRPPFIGDRGTIERGHLALRPPRPGRFAAVAAGVEDLVVRCLAKDPAERPRDAGEARSELARQLQLERLPTAATGVGGLISQVLNKSQALPTSEGLQAHPLESVALLVAEGQGIAAMVAKTVRARGGFVISQHAGRHVALYSGAETHNPAAVARATAAEIAASGARVGLHVARLALRRRGPGSVTIVGDDVVRPERWLPASWHGVHATPAFASVEQVEENTAYFGRDAELSAALSMWDGEGPALLTILGGRGSGKSRFLAELARRRGDLVHLTTGQSLAAVLRSRGLLSGDSRVAAVGDALRRAAPLVVLIDDADQAPAETLDAVEYAVLGGASVPLSIAVAAPPRFVEQRRGWGRRAHKHHQLALPPLAPDAAAALAAELLAPAEYPPADALRQLARWSSGVPGNLVALVRRLKREGAVRPRSHGDGFFLDAAVLERLPPSPAGEWLAARELDALPPDLAGFARVLAVLVAPFARVEAAALIEALERDGKQATQLDPVVGLQELAAYGVLIRKGSEFHFVSAGLQESIAALIDPLDLRRIHAAALEHWRSQSGRAARERQARHAAGAGLAAEAAAAQLELAEAARQEQRLVEADQRFGQALAGLGGDATRARAHLGRGQVLYRLDRSEEALADLAEAVRLARALDDPALAAEGLLEAATVLDWLERFGESAGRVDEARPLVARARRADLDDRLLLGVGRTAWRREDVPAALDLLGRAADSPAVETRTIALLLLGPALAVAGRLDEAEAAFARVLELCRAAGDRVHEGAAFANRMFLWMARGQTDRAAADLRRAIDLAREVGHSRSEQIATYNLAEILYFSARDAEALSLARRARWLQERVVGDAVAEDALLLARIHLARGERADAASQLAWIDAATRPERWKPSVRALIEAARLSLRGADAGEWEDVVEAAASLATEVHLEVLMWRALAGHRPSREAAAVLIATLPLFAPRMNMLFG